MDSVTPEPTSKYNTERGVFSKLDQLRKEEEEQAKKDGNYINMLNGEVDKIKADVNNDGKIDESEYKSYIVKKSEEMPVTQTQANNSYINHNYYHIDNSSILAIGMVCITAIICCYINKRR